MNVSEAIEARRSVKHYDPDHTMPEHDLAELIRLTKLAPSSFQYAELPDSGGSRSRIRQQIGQSHGTNHR